MAEGKQSGRPRWGQWKRLFKRLMIGTAPIGLLAALAWWFWPQEEKKARPSYDVYVATNIAGENRDKTAGEIQAYLTKNFPPDEYEYLGIIAQRLPTSQTPSTTTYVLFKRK